MRSFASARFEWESGDARLRGAPAAERDVLDRVVERIVADLRRRLGGPFTLDELVALYDEGTDWTLEIAFREAPTTPGAWDEGTVAGAAFWRYAREATDFAGGRRLREGASS